MDKTGQSEELHDAWIDLMQRIEEGSFLEQELGECLMKWYGIGKSSAWPKSSLNGVTILHISAACGVKSIVKFIASYIEDPNPTKEVWEFVKAEKEENKERKMKKKEMMKQSKEMLNDSAEI